jgi:hypothetical protein
MSINIRGNELPDDSEEKPSEEVAEPHQGVSMVSWHPEIAEHQTTPRDAAELDALAELVDLLDDAGLKPEQCEEIKESFLRLARQEGRLLAADTLRTLLTSMDGCAAGVALRREILGTDGESLRDAAKGKGFSHVAVSRHTKQINKRLRHCLKGV